MSSHLKLSPALMIAVTIVASAAAIGLSVMLVREFSLTPRVEGVFPLADEVGVGPNATVTLTFNRAMSQATILPSTFILRDEHGAVVPATVTYDAPSQQAALRPASPLDQSSTYEVTLTRGILDRHEHPLAEEKKWRFTTGVKATQTPAEGPGGPILLITSKANGFSQYYAEILRNEGFNEFDVKDLGEVSPLELAKHDITLIGEVPMDDAQIRMFTGWVRGGGTLLTMRPPKKFAKALGLNLSTSEADGPVQHGGYLKIDAKNPGGAGLAHQAIQFHGDADHFVATDATILATLFKEDKTATAFPAVSSIQVGSGTAIVFSYDLAKSVVYTRQGNPEWSGMERDGIPPVRSDDLFYGASEKDPKPDWVDPQTIAIPQADVQQRLLANLMILTGSGKMPLPHFWYLPRGLKAVIVMTGDDHGHGGTAGRVFQRKSVDGCSVENWECIRATSNIFVGSISPADAAYFVERGFEIGLHVYTACADWPTRMVQDSDGVERRQVIRESADSIYSQQLRGFAARYPEIPPPETNRTDCITWGDYDTQPQIELSHQIRLDTNYYYWPAKWVKDKPGLFTGSGLPMRFARRDGTLIDVYQAATQMTDESSQSYPFTVDTLLANAQGNSEYFGVFTANMHNDETKSPGADAIISSAKKHHVPVITAAQLLKWLDGRNVSAFRNLKWSGNQLSFSIDVGVGGNGLEALLPIYSATGDLNSVSLNGAALKYPTRTVAGLSYAVVRAAPGTFIATYGHPAATRL